MRETMLLLTCLTAALSTVAGGIPFDQTLRIEAQSRIVVHVGKAGAFGFAGHAHDVEAPVTGTVNFHASDLTRSDVTLEFSSATLRVTGAGEPAEDVPEVQRVMASDRVLDVLRYPTITFRSRRVAMTGTGANTLVVEGDLTLHGITKPVRVPVRVALEDGALVADGEGTVKQSDFGIRPVTAAGGTVRVRDEVDITFHVRAAR
jgi:polyisoprenoid-binding protein YceI